MRTDFIDDIYDYIIGFLRESDVDPVIAENVVSEFEEGSYCDRLYEEIYFAQTRLRERLRRSGGDKDVLLIIKLLETMMRYISRKMYQYGAMQLKSTGENITWFGFQDE